MIERTIPRFFTPVEFDEVMARMTRLRQNSKTRSLNYAYYVEGKSVSAIAEEFECTKQNVIKSFIRFSVAYGVLVETRANIAASPVARKGAKP